MPELDKLKGGLSIEEQEKIEAFFNGLEEKIDLPVLYRNMLFSHYTNAFEYYLDQGRKTEEIISLMDPSHLGDFYTKHEREFLTLDNAAIIYPLGMRYGQMPMFRVSAELKEEVEPCLLQLALDFTLKRFPAFSAVVKRGFFWHYLEMTNYVIQTEEENDIPCKPISVFLRGFRSFRVLYYKKRISVELFHTITDGTGALIFLRSLIAEYLRLTGKRISCGNGVLDIDEDPDPEEFENEFIKAEGSDDFSTFMDKPSLQLDGKLSNLNITRVIHFEMSCAQLKEVSRRYGGTITAYILAVMFMAARDSISEEKGIINVQVPVNMRKFNGSKTLRNYSMYFNTSMDISEITDREKLVPIINEQIRERGSKESMTQMMCTTGKLIDSLALVPVFLKNPIIQLVYGFFSNRIICNTLSNLGVVNVPKEMENEISKFAMILVPGRPNRASASMATFNDTTVLTLTKANRESTYEEKIYEYLRQDGLDVTLEGSVEYES